MRSSKLSRHVTITFLAMAVSASPALAQSEAEFLEVLSGEWAVEDPGLPEGERSCRITLPLSEGTAGEVVNQVQGMMAGLSAMKR